MRYGGVLVGRVYGGELVGSEREGSSWDLIVSVPDYCLSFYFGWVGLGGSIGRGWWDECWKVR